MSDNVALLIVDMQVNMLDEEMPIYKGREILTTLADLIARARTQGIPVIYVRHNGGPGEPDEPQTPGWEIHPALAPNPGELIVDKTTPDTFASTDLQDKLTELGIETLVIAGMQTDMCITATTQSAVAFSYKTILVEDGHTTFDFPDEPPAADLIAKLNTETTAQVLPATAVAFT